MTNKKGIGIGVTVMAGAGAAACAARTHKRHAAGDENAFISLIRKTGGKKDAYIDLDYRHAESGKHDHNGKELYYSGDSAEAFANVV